MKILFKDTFIKRLEKQLDYIAADCPSRARKFKNDLIRKIKEIPQRPYSYRKFIYFEDETIRDLIFKGYTIVFRLTKDTVEFLVL